MSVASLFPLLVAATPQEVAPGVLKDVFRVAGSNADVWVYRPEKLPAPKLATVLIAPAGSSLFHGMPLNKGDEAEHIPYVRAGMAVVAYATSGQLKDGASDDEMMSALDAFVRSKGGVLDASAALRAAAERHSFIDTARVYAAGHSSAGTLALGVAQSSKILKGCIAYAPATALNGVLLRLANRDSELSKTFQAYMQELEPLNHIEQLNCPVMVFHAADDRLVRSHEIKTYVEALGDHLKAHTFEGVETGGHYNAMIDIGIAKGIDWIGKVEREEGPRPPSAESRKIKGRSLELTLLPGMKTRSDGEARRARDNYDFYWRHPHGYLMEVQLYRSHKDVGWEKVQENAEMVHKRESAKAEKPLALRPNADKSFSNPTMAPISKGPFRGMWTTRKKGIRKSGATHVETWYLLWDRKDAWYAIFKGDDSERAKLHAILESAVLAAPE